MSEEERIEAMMQQKHLRHMAPNMSLGQAAGASELIGELSCFAGAVDLLVPGF
jgi:UPF0716 family protein affecting phage T7 exclusion